MKKIVIITNTAASLLNFRKDLIIYMAQKGVSIFCFATDFTEESKKQLEKLGAQAVDYRLSRGGLNPLADIRNTIKLSGLIKRIQPDIVFSTFAKPVIFGTLAAKMARVNRVVAMLEGLGYFFTDQPQGQSLKTRIVKKIQVALYRIALPRLDRLLFLNNDDPRDLLEKNRIKVRDWKVLGAIGLSLDEFRYVEPIVAPVSFVFVGRLLKEKGVCEFLKAAEMVKKQFENVLFYVVGGVDTENPGALKEHELNHYVKRNIVNYSGFVSNVKDWIAKSSVFVLPSYREGFPRSTQEAMAMGRPVITTDVPGCRETVINGQNGFIVPRWAYKNLAEKMIYFIENKDEIFKMGQESYNIAQASFDASLVNKKLWNLIEKQ